MCSPIHPLFGIEKVTKDFRRSDAAAKARLRGGFRLPQLTTPPKFQKSSFRTVHKTVLQNRRATGARMGLVSTHRLVNIMLNHYAMSRCGLRKLCFGCKKSNFFELLRSQQDLFLCPACLSARNLVQILLLCIEKLCAKFNSMHRVYFCIKFYQTCTFQPNNPT